MSKKAMRAYCGKQGLKLIFDKTWNMVKAVRADGSVAFDGPEYDLIERINTGEQL